MCKEIISKCKCGESQSFIQECNTEGIHCNPIINFSYVNTELESCSKCSE